MSAKKKKKAVREQPPSPPAPPPRSDVFPIVGIGASAGGLEAIEIFLRNVPARSGLAYVIVQHLDPTHKGVLVELLQRASTIPVKQIEDGMKVEPNHVYVIPPNKDVSILHGVLHLMPPIAPRGLNLPIDFFFRSLADDQRERGIGVVLSGMGSDGTLGLRAIKEHAGATFAQDPASAKFDSMPRSAIDAGLVDVVVPVEGLPARILAYASYVPHVGRAEALGEQSHSALEKIFVILRSETGNDFTLYKKSTILRRIERRMGLHQIDQIDHYVRYLRENPQETQLLFKELLIGVTSFFRDPPAWEHLGHDALPALFKARASGSTLRAWVPGCSTGEEAYSLAMLFKEVMDKHQKNLTLQIFATDLDRDAIESARGGIFGENIAADVSPERLRRFFVQDDRGFRVSKDIREMVIFAPQNLVMDPPFTKLDVISCRNVLIYLAPELQKKIVPLFHYSLNPGGILFLGSSETIGSFTNMFAPIDGGKTRLYRRTEARGALVDFPAVQFRDVATPAPSSEDRPPKTAPNLQTLADRLLVQRYSPAGILCNDKGDILYIGGRTGKYLEPAVGRANWNVLAMAREGLRYDLGVAFHAAVRENRTVVVRGVQVGSNGGTQTVDITVERLNEPESLRGLVMVVITDVPAPPKPPTPARLKQAREAKVIELEDELHQSRQESQSLREEMQTSQEELKSTNEELQSTNEELQSTNEELTTSKEEMQSLNEELQTVNHELQAKVEELSRSNNDMKNLLNSTDIATLFLDSELRVRRFTTQTAKLIKLIPGDAGRPITDFATDLDYPELAEDAREVLRTLVYREKVVGTRSGRYFAVRVLPYRTLENVIDGVVITFSDATIVKELEKQLREHGAHLGQMLDALPILWLGFHASGACEAVGNQWIDYTGRPAPEQLGHRWLEQVHSDDHLKASAGWAASVKSGAPFITDLRIRSRSGQYRWFRLTIVPVTSQGVVRKWYGSATDVDDLKPVNP